MALTRLVVCTSDDQVLFSGVSERARPGAKSAVVPVIDDEDETAEGEVISGVYRVKRGADALASARVPVFDQDDEDTGDYHVGALR